jgi:two-component system chemotaxis response regulator CheY
MPEMDGHEVLRRLKSLDKYANVILVTASEHSSALKSCLEEGALDFVPKPFTQKELLNAIEGIRE